MKNPSTVATAFYLDTAKDKYGTEVMLPQMLGEVTKLEVGYVSGPKIGEVGDSLQYFTNLNRLVISGHDFPTLDVSDLENLTYLDVSDNRILDDLKFSRSRLGYLNISRCSSLKFGTSRFGYNISDATIKNTPDIYFTKKEVGRGTDSVWRTFEKDDGSLWAEKWNGSWWYDTNNWDSEAPIGDFSPSSITAGGVLEARVEPSDVENEITGALITTSLTNFAENLLAVDIDRCPYTASTTLELSSENAGFFVSGVGIGLTEVSWLEESNKGSYAATKFLNVHENDIIKTNLITGTKIHNVIDVRMWDNLLGLEEGWEDYVTRENLRTKTSGHYMHLALLDFKKKWIMKDYTINAPNATTIRLDNNFLKSGIKGEKVTRLDSSTYKNVYNTVIFKKGSGGYNTYDRGIFVYNKVLNAYAYVLNYDHISGAIDRAKDAHLPFHGKEIINKFSTVWPYDDQNQQNQPSGKFSVTMKSGGKIYFGGNAIVNNNVSYSSGVTFDAGSSIYTVLFWWFQSKTNGWLASKLYVRTVGYKNVSASIQLSHTNANHKGGGGTQYDWSERRGVNDSKIRDFVDWYFK